jgi:hypothetical protein
MGDEFATGDSDDSGHGKPGAKADHVALPKIAHGITSHTAAMRPLRFSRLIPVSRIMPMRSNSVSLGRVLNMLCPITSAHSSAVMGPHSFSAPITIARNVPGCTRIAAARLVSGALARYPASCGYRGSKTNSV